jgi:four helix bundle protein
MDNSKSNIKNTPLPPNIVLDKSYTFALSIVELYKYLTDAKKEYVLSKQLLRSGTSIGANIAEAQAAISKKDFIAKLSISAKESRETQYWLRLLADSHFVDRDEQKISQMFKEVDSLIRLLTSIIKSAQKYNGNV